MPKFKILQIGYQDTVGSRFNGQDLHIELLESGHQSHHLVWEKRGDNDLTEEICGSNQLMRTLTNVSNQVERTLSMQSVLHPGSATIALNEHFRRADLVHYHLIHNGYFSLAALPLLTRMKPTVWTWHDPWAMTGRCIYPRSCERWRTGCGECPYMEDSLSPMRRDNTRLMWNLKRTLYTMSQIDVIVASKWMLQMAQQSPLASNFRLHHIPFGIDLKTFSPGDALKQKKKLGIRPENTVICLRASISPFKGLEHISAALDRLETNRPLTILTFEDRGLLAKHLGRHQLIDLGWVNDAATAANAYQAADIFLMPSMAEAFGVMAIEAMACGKPTIVFDGTSLPDVIFAPQGGLSVPMGDVDALAQTLKKLIENEPMRDQIGRRARELAEQHYDWKSHVNNILALYEEIIHRHGLNAQTLAG